MMAEEEGSAFLAAIGRAASVEEASYRRLSEEEVRELEARGNVAEDWTRVLIKGEEGCVLAGRIVRCCFYGTNMIDADLKGTSEVEGGGRQAQGLYDSTLIDCVVGPRVLIKRNDCLSKVYIEAGASIIGCGTVACTGVTSFSSDLEVHVGSEVQGRPVRTYPEVGLPEVQHQAMLDKAEEELRPLAERYASRASSSRMVVCEQASLLRCGRVVDSFVGPHAVVSDSELECVTLLSSQSEPSSVTARSSVSHSILQWAAKVSDGALVRHSLLMEHSSVQDKALVRHTVLCPDSSISLGECHHSLLGPFVGFNHLCAVVAVVWPEGRGNVAHGAKIGANHTGRLPDQEAVVGEGVFFGTGVCAKFPLNLSDSPHTLMATGVSLDPQRLHFPFSLVVTARDAPPGTSGLNQLLPAWVLAHSPYTVLRNEEKYGRRGRAQRVPQGQVRTFRPQHIDLMIEARRRLRRALSSCPSAGHFTEREVAGMGANYATRRTVEDGARAYTRWIRRYALHGLLDRLRRAHDPQLWKHQCRILRMEFEERQDNDYDNTDSSHHGKPSADSSPPLPSPPLSPSPPPMTRMLLCELLKVEEEVVAAVEKCKARDDRRGEAVMDNYAANHPPACQDAIIVGLKQRLQELRETVEQLLAEVVAEDASLETLERAGDGESRLPSPPPAQQQHKQPLLHHPPHAMANEACLARCCSVVGNSGYRQACGAT